jgi:invasion protein IalB
MKKNDMLMMVVTIAIVVVAIFKVTNAESLAAETGSNPNHSMKRWQYSAENAKTPEGIKEERSVAWFVANSKEARAQNQACHDDPGIQSAQNCINSLHALQIAFVGGSGR